MRLIVPRPQVNTGQAGEGGGDINVKPAWLQGLTGRGVTVAIVDDGKSIRSTAHIISPIKRSTVAGSRN